ncbi:hypothetical protein ZIOFF_006097 [Zingiber officinale]|uniref:Reverse transcriptase RNase H-like domain-containing protein n=1 Tax=Zingiber officinale TaxID=94328 RepID=A0A8J5LVC9_ZINOF|nr:hypothetical protein ZIOFF_006097 [Zingiber officinale]
MVKTLPDLAIPPANCFVIIESDGCMEGWGGVLKWKPQKFDPKSSELICAYASGKFSPLKSTIDVEIHAIMNCLNSFKIYYLDKEELLIRTDCQAIIIFFNKTAQNKPSRIRWMAFTDFITGLGIAVQFQHIDGKDNHLADALSRLVCFIIGPWNPSEKDTTILAHFEETMEQLESRPHIQVSQHLAGLIHYWTSMKNSLKELGLAPTPHMKRTNDNIWRTSKTPQQGISSVAYESSCLSSKLKKRTLLDVARSKEDYTSTSRTLYQK